MTHHIVGVFFLFMGLLAAEDKDSPPKRASRGADEARPPPRTLAAILAEAAKPKGLPEVPAAALEEMLTIALRSNPEILQAEAALRKAQADLNQARLKATQEVIGAFIERQRAPLDGPNAALDAKARVAQTEAQLRYLLGLGGTVTSEGTVAQPVRPTPEPLRRPELSAEMKEVLAKEVTLAFEGEPSDPNTRGATLGDIIERLKDFDSGLSAVIDNSVPFIKTATSVNLTQKPLRALLLLLADRYKLCFVFRDYGLFVTTPERAVRMYAPTIPEDTPLKL